MKGTIYLRDNAWYKMENVIKMGIATFAKDRSNTYITGEVERGEYVCVIEIPLDKMKIMDKCLKNYFKSFHIYKGGGTEFYNRCIVDLIEPYLKQLNISYKVLNQEEIHVMNRCERIRPIPMMKLIQAYKRKMLTRIKPSDHQQYVLDIIQGFFHLYNIGKIVWACGLGKALLSILIVKVLKLKSILICVPSIHLQHQIKKEILKIFPTTSNILVIGSNGTTDKIQIVNFITILNSQPKFIISTYHSCHLLVDVMFDLKIGDEAHHVVGMDKEKGFRLFHKIKSSKTLFMTATEKTIEQQYKEIYSMDDETIFGKYIDVKSVHWAIENKKITDYNILVLKNTEDEVAAIASSLRLTIYNKEIFISCYMCLKSFEKYNDLTHVLLYTNTTEDAELSKKYINDLLSFNVVSIQGIYNNSLHSKNSNDLCSEVYKFTHTPYGIISCVYIFGEGFDLPQLNGVCIAGNMQSETRIVQYVLRPNRLDAQHPNKKAYVIIPYINTDDWKTENKSYEKVRNIVSQMRNVDENIEQKVFVLVGTNEKKEHSKKDVRKYYEFQENGNELNKLKLRLRYSKALGSKCTEEQDEYNYVRSINSELHITSKKEYIQCQDTHGNFITFPEEYFKLKGVWNTWYDFMGVDTTHFIQSKYDWIKFCKEKKMNSLDDYYRFCEDYDVLPKEPDEFYTHFTNIPSELGFHKNRRNC
jgi:superfamily II DNA or RNA helicase